MCFSYTWLIIRLIVRRAGNISYAVTESCFNSFFKMLSDLNIFLYWSRINWSGSDLFVCLFIFFPSLHRHLSPSALLLRSLALLRSVNSVYLHSLHYMLGIELIPLSSLLSIVPLSCISIRCSPLALTQIKEIIHYCPWSSLVISLPPHHSPIQLHSAEMDEQWVMAEPCAGSWWDLLAGWVHCSGFDKWD